MSVLADRVILSPQRRHPAHRPPRRRRAWSSGPRARPTRVARRRSSRPPGSSGCGPRPRPTSRRRAATSSTSSIRRTGPRSRSRRALRAEPRRLRAPSAAPGRARRTARLTGRGRVPGTRPRRHQRLRLPGLVAAVLPAGPPRRALLRATTRRACRRVELNNTFYAAADGGQGRGWVAATPRGFRFVVKAQRGASVRALYGRPGESVAVADRVRCRRSGSGWGRSCSGSPTRSAATTSGWPALLDAWPRDHPAGPRVAAPVVDGRRDVRGAARRGRGPVHDGPRRPGRAARHPADGPVPLPPAAPATTTTTPSSTPGPARLVPFLDDGIDAYVLFRHDEDGTSAVHAEGFAGRVDRVRATGWLARAALTRLGRPPAARSDGARRRAIASGRRRSPGATDAATTNRPQCLPRRRSPRSPRAPWPPGPPCARTPGPRAPSLRHGCRTPAPARHPRRASSRRRRGPSAAWTSRVSVTHGGRRLRRVSSVAERGRGRIRRSVEDGPGARDAGCVDITDRVAAGGERDMLGSVAFPPGFARVGPQPRLRPLLGRDGDTDDRGVRRSARRPRSLDPASERILLTQQQPYANHNGGWIGFDADGMLLIALGDGGVGWRPARTGPATSGRSSARCSGSTSSARPTASPYSIPADNPFVGRTGATPARDPPLRPAQPVPRQRRPRDGRPVDRRRRPGRVGGGRRRAGRRQRPGLRLAALGGPALLRARRRLRRGRRDDARWPSTPTRTGAP